MPEAAALTVFRGPSIHALVPVVYVAFGADDAPDDEFVSALLEHLPGVREHAGSCVNADGSWDSWGHLFEHACVELQRLGGAEVRCLRAPDDAPAYDAGSVPFEDEEVAVRAARLTLDLFGSLAQRGASDFGFGERKAEFLDLAVPRAQPVQDRAIIRTAQARGIPVTRVAQRVFQLGQGCHRHWLNATKTSRTSVIGNDIAANKDYSRRVLGGLGLPVPRYRRVWTARDAVQAAKEIGFPVVVKPNFGNMGGGVTIGVRNVRGVREAYRCARELGRSAIIEELVVAEDFRLLVIDGRLRAAAHRVPAHVRGDGASTIEQLVQTINADPRRGPGQGQRWSQLELDERAERVLAAAGHRPNTVPSAGEVVYLRRNANTSDGGTAVDVTDDVHPDNREIAERAARAIGLDIAGVDLLTPDVSRSLWESGGCICEINSRPGLRKHLWPAEGTPRDVIGPILDMLFPPGAKSRVPIASVITDALDASAARLIARLLEADGRRVGLATPTEVSIGGRPIGRARGAGPAAARMILLDPGVEAAVFALTPEDVARHGLGYDVCDVCAIVDTGGFHPTLAIEVAGLAAQTSRTTLALRPEGGEDDPIRFAVAVARSLGIAEDVIQRGLSVALPVRPGS